MSIRSVIRSIYRLLPFKRTTFEFVRRFIRPKKEIYQHLHFTGRIEIEVTDASAFYAYHYGFQVENDLFWAGFGNGWEGTSLRLWALLARRHSTILDIGANTGVYALVANCMNSAARVFAFEPVVRVYDRLVRNIALNGGNILPVAAGVSNRSGKATIFDTQDEHEYSASLHREMLNAQISVVEREIDVIRADEFLSKEKISSNLLVKIDAEMHEYEVMQGFGDVLNHPVPTILIEILSVEQGRRIERLLEDKQAVYYEILEGECVRRTDSLGTGQRNYLICGQEEAAQIKLGDYMSHEDIFI